MNPHARQDQVLVEELAGEFLVYDLTRNKAHCLNRTAAFVWQQCDGQTPVAEIATRLAREFEVPVDEELIWLALHRLQQVDLLQEPLPRRTSRPVVSRRDMMRQLGLVGSVAILLPVVTSSNAPAAAQAASPRPTTTTNPCAHITDARQRCLCDCERLPTTQQKAECFFECPQ
jgi:hypothetical protein